MSEKLAMKTIQHYESMTAAEIKAELNRAGVEVQPTIDAIKAIVAQHLHHHRRGVHPAWPIIHAPPPAVSCGDARSLALANQPAALQRGFFSAFDQIAERLRNAATLDHAYIEARALTDAAIDVVPHRRLWPSFAGAFARLHRHCSPPAQHILADSLRHWRILGPCLLELATVSADKASLRLQHDVYAEAPAVDYITRWALRKASDHTVPLLFTIRSLAPLRDAHPHNAASLFTNLLLVTNRVGRLAVFASIVEGYERSFQGYRQIRVPHFGAGAPQFVPGARHDLDLFGHSVCRLPIAHTLGEEMEWANQRLRLWEGARWQ
jgi:hypothetical protein